MVTSRIHLLLLSLLWLLVLSVLLMSNMKRAEAYRLPFTRRRKQHSTVVIFSQACEILESFETFSNLDKDIFGRSRWNLMVRIWLIFSPLKQEHIFNSKYSSGGNFKVLKISYFLKKNMTGKLKSWKEFSLDLDIKIYFHVKYFIISGA